MIKQKKQEELAEMEELFNEMLLEDLEEDQVSAAS